ncbi:MAG: ABC transporter permease [Deltaproteobacteria bacterium]|nr:ABC transporter permease [Deltaproteobacteria bacterium]
MWLRIKIAFRNAFRNRRRSLLNIFMIASAVAAIVVFEGFTHNMISGLRETTVQTQTGHLQLALRSFWEKKSNKPKQNLIKSYQRVVTELLKDKRIQYAAGKLEFFGLLSKGDESMSVRIITLDPQKEVSRNKHFRFREGKALHKNRPFQVAVGNGLARKLGLKANSNVSILTHTYDGVVNAMDFEVSGIFQTDIAEFDDSTLLIPLKTAQELLDTTAVEQIVVGLKSSWDTTMVKDSVRAVLAGIDPDIQVKTWYQIATLYKQVSMFNRVQNTMVQFILMALVLLSIMNTVGMSILERTGEIGTIRALGEKRAAVVFQFLMEGLFLGLGGVLLGILGAICIAKGFNAMNIPIIFPGASAPIFIKIEVLYSAILKASLLGLGITILAAVIPAHRASKMNIVEALRYNI